MNGNSSVKELVFKQFRNRYPELDSKLSSMINFYNRYNPSESVSFEQAYGFTLVRYIQLIREERLPNGPRYIISRKHPKKVQRLERAFRERTRIICLTQKVAA